ncbi:thioredoxin domain-containing protein [Maribacter hydrothermalis]|uniref:Thioredoxin n=1 Tax=Maribacter hydrothermalis TaxID=1836467 RepID=A0A1B7ZFJ9_9FLAO|nr:thioredoxin domain-containing protein [Maribacter hydrothermalis]APQ17862.1 thioredoxin domain-containing protein [Maribacter hydrothermalis]OBR42335.1 thioredoxin [Maribacter hydrothermalis]
MAESPKYTNKLIEESSPYLLQHAHNPVNWVAWNDEVLQQAKEEQKLILISIGYAACHWCHVMEHECFEDEEVAKVMNSNFINIKIDREERPDIDHIYMDALQMMTGSGGWPLNILALPNGKPFWGATFVKKQEWIQVLNQLQQLYVKDPNKIIDYANNMAQGLTEINSISIGESQNLIQKIEIDKMVADWSNFFDTFLGGYKRAPKFMMPVNLNFLLHYGYVQKDTRINEYVNTTLTRMAWGGIFDHVGGGFSRYSVDTKWHVPHFEKMLYDNGLLISLYANAYAATKNILYKNVAEKCISFLEEELLDKSNGLYSSLDADSLNANNHLEEGAFYVWQKHELIEILKDDYLIFADYFNINSYGFWEENNYVLIRDHEAIEIAKKHSISEAILKQTINNCLIKLKAEREKRNRPRLDDKILTSWNGLALKGLTEAYRYLENETYLDLALKNAHFILNNMMTKDGGLYRNHKNGKSTIEGFLEDYASVINAFLELYEVSFDEKWLNQSLQLTEYVIKNFSDTDTGLFFFTPNHNDHLIRKTLEVADNVIPSSNSIMAHNLHKLSKYFPENHFEIRLHQMMKTMNSSILENPQNHANWLHLSLLMSQEYYEVVSIGDNFKLICQTLQKNYLPNVIFAASNSEISELPLLMNRYVKNKTLIYVCKHGTCQMPVEDPNTALKLINSEF